MRGKEWRTKLGYGLVAIVYCSMGILFSCSISLDAFDDIAAIMIGVGIMFFIGGVLFGIKAWRLPSR